MATEGNWMHVHYESRIQAKKALSKTGRVFGRGIMVGVLPCIDQVHWVINRVSNLPVIIFHSTVVFKA